MEVMTYHTVGAHAAGRLQHQYGIRQFARASSGFGGVPQQSRTLHRGRCRICKAQHSREGTTSAAKQRQQPLHDAASGLRAAALAFACAMGIFSTLGVSQALAEEESTLSSSEKRAQESQRRRDLLGKAREKALAGGGQVAGEAPATGPAPKQEEDKAGSKLAASIAKEEPLKKQETPVPKPQPAFSPPKPQYSYENKAPQPASKASPSQEAPKALAPQLKSIEPPAPPAFKAEPPKPAPKPELPQLPSLSPAKKADAPKPSLASAKQSAAPQKGGGKQRGPLPMTVAQILVLGIFGGIGYAATKEAQKTAQAVEVTAEYIEKGYNAVERYVAKYAGKPSETVAAAPRTPSGKDATEV